MSETPAYVKNLKKESVVQSVINCLTDAMRSKELKPGDPPPCDRMFSFIHSDLIFLFYKEEFPCPH